MFDFLNIDFHNSIIHKIISREEQYIQDLDLVESDFIKPLRMSQPPVLPLDKMEDFIDNVFGNILDLRECNRHLLEVLYVRQREQAPIIHGIGDIFLDAATEFRLAYPIYIGHFPIAEKRMKDEIENNPTFRLFIEVCEFAAFTISILSQSFLLAMFSTVFPARRSSQT
jgi:RHO1 GDP-GTP exchange protein 1/2